jgi:ABC-type nitrate/sulfonate/bicarbonate transport system substrate-binding protein
MISKKVLRIHFTTLLLGIALTINPWAACAPAGAASSASKLVIAHASMIYRNAPLWLAQERGLFAKYGLQTEIVLVRGAPTSIAGLASETIHVAQTGAAAALGGVSGGVDLKFVAALNNRPPFALVVSPAIKRAEQIKGKRFGVQSIGGTIWMRGMLALEHEGLDPQRDNINIVAVGDSTVISQALISGTIDAATLDGSFASRLNRQGFPILAEFQPLMLSQGILLKKNYVNDHPAQIENFLKGLLEGMAFAFSPANKNIVIEIITRRLRISNPLDLEEGYQDMLKGMDRKPYPATEGVRNVQRLLVRAGNAKLGKVAAEELVDDRIIKKLDASGFIDGLYRKYGVQ